MGTSVESYTHLLSGDPNKRYLFLIDPTELYVGFTLGETHSMLLEQSAREAGEVIVAGQLLVLGGGREVIIEGRGSHGLKIEPRNPTPVADFIRSLPGAEGAEVTVSRQ